MEDQVVQSDKEGTIIPYADPLDTTIERRGIKHDRSIDPNFVLEESTNTRHVTKYQNEVFN